MSERGFTLVEVLVAMMIMAILAVMAWQGVDGIVTTRTIAQARLENTLRLSTVLGQLEQDVQSVQDTGAVDALRFDGATLRLTRRADTGVQVVTWSLQPNADGSGNSWLRWAGPAVRTSNELQETWLRTQQFQGVEPGQLRTLPSIVQWQVYCYRGNSWSNCQSTGNLAATAPAPGASTPPPVRQALPTGLRVVLEFAGGGSSLAGTLTRDIAMGP